MLCSVFQRYNSKAIHNLLILLLVGTWLCSVFQRYNSKAIHNIERPLIVRVFVVLSISKIQFKSNSQHAFETPFVATGCAQYFKDTIQKQFTTMYSLRCNTMSLCSVFQRYNSKAIHNMCRTD